MKGTLYDIKNNGWQEERLGQGVRENNMGEGRKVGMPTERSYQTKTLSDDNSKRQKQQKKKKTHWVGI